MLSKLIKKITIQHKRTPIKRAYMKIDIHLPNGDYVFRKDNCYDYIQGKIGIVIFSPNRLYYHAFVGTEDINNCLYIK